MEIRSDTMLPGSSLLKDLYQYTKLGNQSIRKHRKCIIMFMLHSRFQNKLFKIPALFWPKQLFMSRTKACHALESSMFIVFVREKVLIS